MSLAIPNTTATATYVQWGGSLLANNGWIFAANGSLDIVLLVGPNTGLQTSSQAFTIPPGQSPLAQGTDEFIHGVLVRAAGGVLSTPAQQYSGALFESQRASIGAGTPFTGTVSSSGSITPGPSMINGITGYINAAGTPVLGTGYTSVRNSAGIYTVTFTPSLSSAPIVDATSVNDSGIRAINYLSAPPTASSFQIVSFDVVGATNASQAFNFIAIVPQ